MARGYLQRLSNKRSTTKIAKDYQESVFGKKESKYCEVVILPCSCSINIVGWFYGYT
jgi:hypothetical protein